MKERKLFGGWFWIVVVCVLMISVGFYGYRRKRIQQYFLDHPVMEYSDEQREAVRHGNHDYTHFLLNHSLSLYIYNYIDFTDRQMEIVLAEDSLCAEAWFIRGLLYSDEYDYEKAIPYFEKYLTLNPHNKIWITSGNDTCSNQRAMEVIKICREGLNN